MPDDNSSERLLRGRGYSQYATEWAAFSARCHCDVRKRIA